MPNTLTVQFLGGAGTVTGSKHLVRCGERRVLLDCGLFQGLKALRLRNWAVPAFDPRSLDAIVLSHAHIDHSGYLPLAARRGFRGPVYCTSGTADLLGVLLPDAAHLQEEEADAANRHGYSKHGPALPLYTSDDAQQALRLLKPQRYDEPVPVTDGVTALFRRAGHILGSATVELRLGTGNLFRLVFSGDLGRWNQPILRDPELVAHADVLLLESTYGDRTHAPDPATALARIVNEAVHRGGVLLVPAFAVGRAQELVWMLRRLENERRIPSLPVYIDSPMATDVSAIYCRHPEDHDLEMQALADRAQSPLSSRRFHIVTTPAESKSLNRITHPAIILSASGMATGGRVLHHLKMRLPDPKTTVLLVGFQAIGTRGRSLQDGAAHVKMHGELVPVHAKVETLDGLSAHADREEIFRWLAGFTTPPACTYTVHGEPEQAAHLAETIRTRLGWHARPAKDAEIVDLMAAQHAPTR